MLAIQYWNRDRAKGAIGAAAIHAVLGYALLIGLAVDLPRVVTDSLETFSVAPPRPVPPEPVAPHPIAATRPEGAASPPNLRSKATEIVAPIPIVPPIAPPPVVTAPTPGIGDDPSSGAADVAGPGTGSGGEGTGTGSGRYGDGDGDGGSATPPRWRSGRLRDSDFPEGALEAGIGGTVSVRYTVATSGRVTECSVTRSSGHELLDTLTCRLIRERFRFDPSRDAEGRPVRSIIVENHSWILDRELDSAARR